MSKPGTTALLPVHGFVLAGGKSSRMGVDKAALKFRGRPMVEIAVEKLRGFCAEVSIAGNRDDLRAYAPVVHEMRVDRGPAAGIEAGLLASSQQWAMFIPVDMPLLPEPLLRRWAAAVLERESAGCAASFLMVRSERQPACCMVRRDAAASIQQSLEQGERRVFSVLSRIHEQGAAGWLWACDVAECAPTSEASELPMEFWFSNVNTRQELAEAESWAATREERAADPLRG